MAVATGPVVVLRRVLAMGQEVSLCRVTVLVKAPSIFEGLQGSRRLLLHAKRRIEAPMSAIEGVTSLHDDLAEFEDPRARRHHPIGVIGLRAKSPTLPRVACGTAISRRGATLLVPCRAFSRTPPRTRTATPSRSRRVLILCGLCRRRISAARLV